MSGPNEVAENVAIPPPDAQVNNQGNQDQPPRQSGWQIFQSIATRMLIMYFAMNAMTYFRGGGPKTSPVKDSTSPASHGSSDLPGNMFPRGTKFVNIF